MLDMTLQPPNIEGKRIPSSWRELLDRPDVFVLDTEATDNEMKSAEIVEAAVIDTRGKVRFNEVIWPTSPPSAGAVRVHGLSSARLRDLGAEPWHNHHANFCRVLSGASHVLIYNAEFDLAILRNTVIANGADMHPEDYTRPQFRCMMREYAVWRNEPDPRFPTEPRWHKLKDAYLREVSGRAQQEHRALADCRMTLALVRAVAAKSTPGGVSYRRP